jgi:hypothetical protein
MAEQKQVTFKVNAKTLAEIEKLKKEFNVDSSAAVLRRALALARVATENSDEDNTFTFIDRKKEKQKLLLDG